MRMAYIRRMINNRDRAVRDLKQFHCRKVLEKLKLSFNEKWGQWEAPDGAHASTCYIDHRDKGWIKIWHYYGAYSVLPGEGFTLTQAYMAWKRKR
jgi:hypothetical protein